MQGTYLRQQSQDQKLYNWVVILQCWCGFMIWEGFVQKMLSAGDVFDVAVEQGAVIEEEASLLRGGLDKGVVQGTCPRATIQALLVEGGCGLLWSLNPRVDDPSYYMTALWQHLMAKAYPLCIQTRVVVAQGGRYLYSCLAERGCITGARWAPVGHEGRVTTLRIGVD